MAPAEGALLPDLPGYVKQRGGPILRDGRVAYMLLTRDVTHRDGYAVWYAVADSASRPLVEFTCARAPGGRKCRTDFAGLDATLMIDTPEVPITEIVGRFIRDGVLVDGRVAPDGVEAYAKKYNAAFLSTTELDGAIGEAAQRARCKDCDDDYRDCNLGKSYRRHRPVPRMPGASCEGLRAACVRDRRCSEERAATATAAPN